MIVTNEKIEVTVEMMESNNMTRHGQYGVPADPHDSTKGLCWKDLIELTDDDFNKIEQYFLNKSNN